jgi:hypothetical protein
MLLKIDNLTQDDFVIILLVNVQEREGGFLQWIHLTHDRFTLKVHNKIKDEVENIRQTGNNTDFN